MSAGDRGIGVRQAEGMLSAIRSSHECGEPCTSEVTHGDGRKVQLVCPYSRLDVNVPGDRKIIGSIYASEAIGATGR